MSNLNVDFTFNIYATDGSTVAVVDTTPDYSAASTGGYGSPNIAKSAITATRLLIGNYTDILAQSGKIAGDSLVQYRQYVKTGGLSQTYDNKTISVGSYFIPYISGLTVASGDTFTDTGVYVSLQSFLPTQVQDTLTITNLGLGSDNTVVPDVLWDVQYEVYGLSVSAPFASVAGRKYMVYNTGTASFASQTYRVGEVIIGDGTHQISVSGGALVSALESSSERTFITTYNLEYGVCQASIKVQTNNCICDSDMAIAKIYNLLDALYFSQWSNNVSYSKATDIISAATITLNTLNSCIA